MVMMRSHFHKMAVVIVGGSGKFWVSRWCWLKLFSVKLHHGATIVTWISSIQTLFVLVISDDFFLVGNNDGRSWWFKKVLKFFCFIYVCWCSFRWSWTIRLSWLCWSTVYQPIWWWWWGLLVENGGSQSWQLKWMCRRFWLIIRK